MIANNASDRHLRVGEDRISCGDFLKFKALGIDFFNMTPIDFKFVISVNTSRLEFFNMFFQKFLRSDGLVIHGNGVYLRSFYTGTESKFGIDLTLFPNIEFHQNLINSVNYSHFPTITEEPYLLDGVEYTRLTCLFRGFNSIILMKWITDLTDCVEFLSSLYGYSPDGSETLLVNYKIGTIVNLVSNPETGDWVISAYEWKRDQNLLNYVLEPLNATNSSLVQRHRAGESEIKPSRGRNLDILLRD